MREKQRHTSERKQGQKLGGKNRNTSAYSQRQDRCVDNKRQDLRHIQAIYPGAFRQPKKTHTTQNYVGTSTGMVAIKGI